MYVRLLLLGLFAFTVPAQGGIFTPKERMDFWREHYTVLSGAHDQHINAAYTVFDTIKAAAGSRPGVIPQLLVIKETPYGFNLPVSLPDGGIILSREIIERIYSEQGDAESKLAFILGHELAHLYSEDFWHVQFFRLMTLYSEPGGDETGNAYDSFLDNREELIKKELYADEQGLIYMTLANYDPGVVVKSGRYQSFFDEWNRKIAELRSEKYVPLVPEEERRKTVKARLEHIAGQSALYRMGLLYLLANNYEKAIRLLDEYRLVFPGREVYHNLALGHHFAAISRYTPDAFVSGAIPLKFSHMLDPAERLFLGATRDIETSDARYYEEQLSQAIEYYRECIRLDPGYLPAYINLATAQIGSGKYYNAIGDLMDADAKIGESADTDYMHAALYNNLGIAFQLIGQSDTALAYYQSAADKYGSADARYNLGRFHYLHGDARKAKRYWKRFLHGEQQGPYARLSRDVLSVPLKVSDIMPDRDEEAIQDLRVHAKFEHPGGSRIVRNSKSLAFDGNEITYYHFDNDVEILVANNRIALVSALSGYRGESARGIRNGASMKIIRETYGDPGKILSIPNGAVYNYPQQGIGFLFREGTLYNWILY